MSHFHLNRKVTIFILSSILATSLTMTEGVALEIPYGFETQASRRIPVNDDRFGALWEEINNSTNGDTHLVKWCSANYIGNNFWLTAHHCIARNPKMKGFIIQGDGERAPIESFHFKSVNDDLVLVKVGTGITAKHFDIADELPPIGSNLTLTGFANTNGFASSSEVKIVEYVSELDTGWFIYRDIIKSISLTASRSCDGDSGGAVYKGNVLYAVHTGGARNPSCSDLVNSPMWHSSVVSRKDWIKDIVGEVPHPKPESSSLDQLRNLSSSLY